MAGLRVPVAELLRHPGMRAEVETDARVGPLRSVESEALADPPPHVSAHLDALSDGVVATGAVSFSWVSECRRCLEAVSGTEVARFREVYAHESEQEGDDVLPLEADTLDLEPLVRELVLSSLPLAPLCGPGCAGPDPERFPTRNADEVAEADAAAPDPRWAALDDLDL